MAKYGCNDAGANCEVQTDMKASAVIELTNNLGGKNVSSVFATGAIKTKAGLLCGDINNLRIRLSDMTMPSGWWRQRDDHPGGGAWPAFWPADPVVYCPLTVGDGLAAGASAELVIRPGTAGDSMEPAIDQTVDLKVIGGAGCASAITWVFSCSWVGGGGTAIYVPFAPSEI